MARTYKTRPSRSRETAAGPFQGLAMAIGVFAIYSTVVLAMLAEAVIRQVPVFTHRQDKERRLNS